jgi:hypothetical protein
MQVVVMCSKNQGGGVYRHEVCLCSRSFFFNVFTFTHTCKHGLGYLPQNPVRKLPAGLMPSSLPGLSFYSADPLAQLMPTHP